MSSNMKNSNRNKETRMSEKFEKSLQNWKLPPSSASDFFKRSRSCCFSPDFRVKTVEKATPLDKGYSTFPLFPNLQGAHQLRYEYVHVGMIQVGLKPTKLGSNSSAIICLRDKRLRKFAESVLGMVESSLCDGPIYFSYFPRYCVALSDAREAFCIDVKIEGDENIILMYKSHYELQHITKLRNVVSLFDMSRYSVDKRGETTLFLTHIAQSKRLVSRKIPWDLIAAGKESVAEMNLPSSSSGGEMGAVGSAKIDWKETAKAHVLKVDVPGFKKEEIKVEVEDGRIIQISGERSNEQEEQEEEDEGKWHCVERRSDGKFLRRLRLPENAKLDEVKAAVENGVLTVTVAKEEVDRKAQVRAVHISG